MPRQNLRINIPSNADLAIALGKSILAKHTTDAAGSPLAGLNMADMSAKVAAADSENKRSAELRRDAETATQKRDAALGAGGAVKGTVEYYIKASRDILLGVHKGNEQTLGDWGFDVDTSVRKAAKPTTAVARATA